MLLFTSFFSLIVAGYFEESHQEDFGHEEHDHTPPHYSFEYTVHDPHSGDEKSHHEERYGDVVKGYYTMKEADGTTRHVKYTADKHNGFNAEVVKIGHPEHHHEQEMHHQIAATGFEHGGHEQFYH